MVAEKEGAALDVAVKRFVAFKTDILAAYLNIYDKISYPVTVGDARYRVLITGKSTLVDFTTAYDNYLSSVRTAVDSIPTPAEFQSSFVDPIETKFSKLTDSLAWQLYSAFEPLLVAITSGSLASEGCDIPIVQQILDLIKSTSDALCKCLDMPMIEAPLNTYAVDILEKWKNKFNLIEACANALCLRLVSITRSKFSDPKIKFFLFYSAVGNFGADG